MPVQNRPVEPSAFHELKARVDKMEAEQKRQGRQLVTVDRIVTADLPAPSEGQIAVEASSDAAKYYANGEWREFGGGEAGQWCRVYMTGADQTVTAGSRNVVTFDTVNNNDPTYYSTTTTFGGLAIEILQTGVYAFTYRLKITSYPTQGFLTEMNGIDFSSFLYYEKTHMGILTGNGVHDSYVFRCGPTYGEEPPQCHVIVSVPASATASVVVDGGTSAERTYMEIVRLGSCPVVGDPTP